MKNYLYFDVEYANTKNKSICQMGLMIEDAITRNPTFPELELLVNPEDDFDINCVNVHHISKGAVENAKTFREIWPSIEKYFVNSVVIGHNVSNSDLDALCKNLIRYNIPLPELYFIDTYTIAKECISPLQINSYSLSSLCEFFDIDIDCEHNAFDDACACSDLFRCLIESFGINPNDYVCHYVFHSNYSYSPYLNSLSAIRELTLLLGDIKGMLSDRRISSEETAHLKEWYSTHQSLKANKEGAEVLNLIGSVLSDNIVTVEEAEQIERKLVQIAQIFSSSEETKATQTLQGIIRGIKADEELNEEEISNLQTWLYKNDYLTGHYPYDRIKTAVDKTLEDRIVTPDEQKYLLTLFDELFNPVKKANELTININNNEFCLSGDFSHGSKKDVENYIFANGGTVAANVRKKTNYVVVGSYGSAAYSNGTYGTKVKKAMEIGVTVITEKQLYNEP